MDHPDSIMTKDEARPIATVEEAVAFDARRPETATRSRIVNLVVEAIPEIAGVNCKALARRLGVSERALSGALEFDTGLPFDEFLRLWRVGMVARLRSEKTPVKGDAAARRLGFYSRTSLWLFMERNGLKRRRKGMQRAELEAELEWHRRMVREVAAETGFEKK